MAKNFNVKEKIVKVAEVYPFLLVANIERKNRGFVKYQEVIGIASSGLFAMFQPVDIPVVEGVTAKGYLQVEGEYKTTLSLCHSLGIDPKIVIWLN
jgi:hypothetical protein